MSFFQPSRESTIQYCPGKKIENDTRQEYSCFDNSSPLHGRDDALHGAKQVFDWACGDICKTSCGEDRKRKLFRKCT